MKAFCFRRSHGKGETRPMSDIDHSLLFKARKFIDAANVHELNTWIFCYEMSPPKSEPRVRYEKKLREFVAAATVAVAVSASADLD
jgi:hypothetical protein